jgi:hypothetical protein
VALLGTIVIEFTARAGAAGMPGSPGPKLSDQQRAVSAIAIQNGDRRFLMLDKSRGELLLFVDGQPVFQGAALVGESRADDIPPYLFTKPFSVPAKLSEKVTPRRTLYGQARAGSALWHHFHH